MRRRGFRPKCKNGWPGKVTLSAKSRTHPRRLHPWVFKKWETRVVHAQNIYFFCLDWSRHQRKDIDRPLRDDGPPSRSAPETQKALTALHYCCTRWHANKPHAHTFVGGRYSPLPTNPGHDTRNTIVDHHARQRTDSGAGGPPLQSPQLNEWIDIHQKMSTTPPEPPKRGTSPNRR